MAFTERHEHKVEIIPPYNILQCRRADIVEKDGVEVGRQYHRHVKHPGDDMTGECAEMQAVAAALWTDEAIAAYAASIADREMPAHVAAITDMEAPANDPTT